MGDEILFGKRVLVVEDEMLVAMQIEDMLADLGCSSIMLAATVDSALQVIENSAFDLATLDVNLDDARSTAVARALRDHQIPFTFATGYSEHGFEGFQDRPVLSKPYSFSQFKEVLAKLLGHDVP